MPRISDDAVAVSAGLAYAELTKAAVRRLADENIVPLPSVWTPEDALAARICRSLFWMGPSANAPGAAKADERRRPRAVAAAAAGQARKLVRRRDVPDAVAVTIDDGEIHPIKGVESIVSDYMRLAGQQWMFIPLRRWWEEAKALPRGPEGVTPAK